MINATVVRPNFYSVFFLFISVCVFGGTLQAGALPVRTDRESNTMRNPFGKPTNT